MTDTELSIRAGKDRNFLAITKYYSIGRYNKMKEMGICEYIDESNRLRMVASGIYYDLAPNKLLSEFYREYCKDITKSIETFYNLINNAGFNSTNSIMSISLFNKLTELDKQYKEYKKIRIKYV